METNNKQRSKIFGLQTAPNLFGKLLWEQEQLDRSLSPYTYRYPSVEPIFHVYNCAITAWHLTDWLWESASEPQRKMLAEKFSFDCSKGRRAFAFALTRSLPELAACRDIADGSKHAELTKPKSPVRVETEFAVLVGPSSAGLEVGAQLLCMHIWLEGQNMTAQVFFDRIVVFWRETMEEIGMISETSKLFDLLPEPITWPMPGL